MTLPESIDPGAAATPTPHALRPHALPPVPESARKARELSAAAKRSVERTLESARRLRAEERRIPVPEVCPDTLRSSVWAGGVK